MVAHQREAKAAASREAAAVARAVSSARPMPSPGKTARLSSAGRVAVVGESHYQPALSLAANGAVVTDFKHGVRTWCALVPEPSNPHDRHAVRVDCLTGHGAVTVGYLDREAARRYQPALMHGLAPVVTGICPGVIMGGGPKFYGIWLNLSDPERVVMHGSPPLQHIVVDSDAQVAVTGEQQYQETLVELHVAAPAVTNLYATLVPYEVTRGKHTGQKSLQVLIDGRPVGELSALMGARYHDLFREGGRCCEAALTAGSKAYPEVTLRLPRVTAGSS